MPVCPHKGAVPANQRAGTGRLPGSGCAINGRRAGPASSGGWAARNLLMSLIDIKVAPELAVELLASGAIYECRQLHWVQKLIDTYVSTADRECLLQECRQGLLVLPLASSRCGQGCLGNALACGASVCWWKVRLLVGSRVAGETFFQFCW